MERYSNTFTTISDDDGKCENTAIDDSNLESSSSSGSCSDGSSTNCLCGDLTTSCGALSAVSFCVFGKFSFWHFVHFHFDVCIDM